MRSYFKYQHISVAIALVIATLLLSACNAHKKNTAATRQYTEFITRYNIHYNGDKHYRETLADMEAKYEDDYSRLLFMHPVQAKSDPQAPQPAGSFDRSIEKAQKAIQVRSIKKKPQRKAGRSNDPEYKEWMKRDEYNPFLHNDWMMLGRSQYYNGDFADAAATFLYIIKHFTWLPATVTEAKLWQAQAYINLGWLDEADIILTRIKASQLTNKELHRLYDLAYADYWLKREDYAQAAPYLEKSVEQAKGAQRTRLQFLLGQTYQHIGNKAAALKAFKSAGSGMSTPYRTKFNARIKQSETYSGSNISSEVKALKRMTKYDRNKDYLDQIYYAIANLYLSRQDTAQALQYYNRAAEQSIRQGIDMAIAQLAAGNIYYERSQYDLAQPRYAIAVPLLPQSYPDYKQIKHRSDILDELAVYAQNVALQDSLLRISKLTPEQQYAWAKRMADDLIKREKEEAQKQAQAQNMGYTNVSPNAQLTDRNARDFAISTDDSWYFYNKAMRAAGKTAFQRTWGARKLEDDWRRSNKSAFNEADFTAEIEEMEKEASPTAETDSPAPAQTEPTAAANDAHQPEYYLAQVPNDAKSQAAAHDVIQDGLYNMGIILKDKMEDYPATLHAWNRLLTDYPDNVYRLDIYYNLYLMLKRQGDDAAAEQWRALILKDFSDSPYGQALQNPNYIENLRQMESRQESLYARTYENYLANENDSVHAAYKYMEEHYPTSKIMPKFMFLNALAYVTEGKPQQFNDALKQLLARYPDTDLTPLATAWLKGMAQGRELQSSEENMRGMIWNIRLSNDSTLVTETDTVAPFVIDDSSPQVLLLVFDTNEISANQLLYEVARHNFGTFVVKDFDLELMNFGQLGIVVVSGFGNLGELEHYRKVMDRSDSFKLPAEVRAVPISRANFDTLLQQALTLEDYFKFLETE